MTVSRIKIVVPDSLIASRFSLKRSVFPGRLP